jgi:transcriptional activator SPT8
VVSCMSLLPGEKGFLSGSWDGTVREWDLNTGQTVRSYPTHGAQISSISLRPYAPPTPTPSPEANRIDEDGETRRNGIDFAVSVGPKFNSSNTDRESNAEAGKEATTPKADPPADAAKAPEADADVTMSQAPSPYDPLFDDDADADGETVMPSGNVTMPTTPGINDMAPPSPPAAAKVTPSKAKFNGPGLALPGAPGVKQENVPSSAAASGSSTPLFSLPQPVASSSREAAATIPVLSKDTYKAFSDDVFLTSSMDGQVVLMDRRVRDYEGSKLGVGRLMPGERAPPWCMSVSLTCSSSRHQISDLMILNMATATDL